MSIDRGIDKDVMHVYNYSSAMKRSEPVPFTETWMDLDTVIQNEVCQKEKNKLLYNISYMWNIEKWSK